MIILRLFLGVLNGSFIFLSDLAKKLTINCEFHFIKVSSYEGLNSTGMLTEIIGLTKDIENRDVIIVEDIIDTGRTMKRLIKTLKEKNPQSISICTLLYKDCDHKEQDVDTITIEDIDFIGKIIPDIFVVGYGLDYNNLGRNLEIIYALDKRVD